MNAPTHTCSYFCDKPECIKAQRDELRDKLAALESQPDSASIYDGVNEAFNRLLENGAALGPASAEDAILVSRYRRQLLAIQPVPVEPDVIREKRSLVELHGLGGSDKEIIKHIDALKSALQRAQEERDAANDKALRVLRGQFTQICSYCGWEANREGAQWTDLQSHIKQCEHHPLVKAESINRRMVELLKEATDELREYLDGPCALTKSRTDTDCGCVSCTVRKAMRPLINEAMSAELLKEVKK